MTVAPLSSRAATPSAGPGPTERREPFAGQSPSRTRRAPHPRQTAGARPGSTAHPGSTRGGQAVRRVRRRLRTHRRRPAAPEHGTRCGRRRPRPPDGPRPAGRRAASPPRNPTRSAGSSPRPSSSPSWRAGPRRSSPATRPCGSPSTACRAPCTPSPTTCRNCSTTKASPSARTTSSPPAPATDLDNGDEIVVRYGRPVTLTLDGHRRQVWTTARTVDEALRQLGVRAEGAYLSVSRSSAISRTGLTLDVRTERTVTFMADGRERTVRTNAATVREALDEAGIALRWPGHHVRAAGQLPARRADRHRHADHRHPAGARGALRLRGRSGPRTPTLFRGTEVVEQQGRPGVRRVTYALRTVNGVRQKPRKIAEETVREPVTQRVQGRHQSRCRTPCRARTGWTGAALAHCESGGRSGAVDSSGTYGGLYQFDTGTWQRPRRQRPPPGRLGVGADVPGEEALRAAGGESVAALRP